MDPSAATLVEVLQRRALETPERPLFTFLPEGEGEGSTLTFSELDARARAVASRLEGVPAGTRVVLVLPPGLDYIAALFGCLYAGVIAVLAYPPHPARLRRPMPRLLAIIQDSGATVALTHSSLLTRLEAVLPEQPALAALRWIAADAPGDISWSGRLPSPRDVALLQYTSGSTSLPKGVVLTHASVMHQLEAMRRVLRVGPEDVHVNWLPPFHDMGLFATLFKPVYVGMRSVLMPPAAFLQMPSRWLSALSRFKGTIAAAPDFAYDLCARRVTQAQRAGLDLSRWKVAINGAEPVRAQTLERFAETFASTGFERESFAPAYGLAEFTLMVSCHRDGGPRPWHVQKAELTRGRAVPAISEQDDGRTLIGCGRGDEARIVVVEPDTGRPLPSGHVGEIWVAGPSLARGYWERPEETDQTFQARLPNGEGPFLRTGDLGVLGESGELFVTGRAKDLMILRGRNHYPQDAEHAVEGVHPALRSGGGAAFTTETGGEERLVLVHEVDPHAIRPGAAGGLPLEEISAAVRAALLEECELDLSELVLIRAGSLPKTSSGKVQRRACRAQWEEGTLPVVARWITPGASGQVNTEGGEVHLSPTETALAAFWRETLGCERVHPEDDFFALGGQSLLAIQVLARIASSFGVELPLQILFEAPKLGALARRVDEARAQTRPASPLLPVEPRDRFPLSPSQQRLWLIDQFNPGSPLYNIAIAVRLTGLLDISKLERALAQLVHRHAALRTRIDASGLEPMQAIDPPQAITLPLVDLSRDEDPEHAAAWHAADEGRQPFQLEAGPLFRAKLLRVGAETHVLVLTVHHIVFDGASALVLIDELGANYRAGDTTTLTGKELHFGDFARWQHDRLTGPRLEEHLTWWRARLADAPSGLSLPTARPRPESPTGQGARLPVFFSASLTERLRGLGHRHGGTLFTVLLAGLGALFSRLGGQEKVVVGAPVAGRGRSEWERVIGFFVNTVALPLDLSGAPTVSALLGRARQTVLDALAHQEVPFEKVVEALQYDRALGASPLFQAMLVFQPATSGTAVLPGPLQLRASELDLGTAKLDLELQLEEAPEGLRGYLQYSTDLFDADAIARMVGSLRAVLEAMVARPEQPVGELPLLDSEERHRVLRVFNDTRRDYRPDVLLHQLIEEQAARTPDAEAVRIEGQSLTYRDLDARANQLAHHLRGLGVGAETCVGVCLERSLDLVVALLGVLKAGAAYVPLDPSYPRERLALMLQDARVPVLLTHDGLRGLLPRTPARIVCLDTERVAIAAHPPERPGISFAPDNLAYVIFTSGSTGRPKGGMNTHRGICNRLLWMQEAYGLDASDRVLQKTPFGFDVSVWEFFWPLMTGARLVLAKPGGHQDAAYLAELIASEGITTLHFVPSMLQAFLEVPEVSRCTTLRRVISSGEALPHALMERCLSRLALPAGLHNLYGPTEAAVDVTAWECKPGDGPLVPIGKPIANLKLHVLDAHLQPVPVGIAGELFIGGVGLGRGYLGRPGLTAERFIPDPFGPPGSRLYRTGDLARYLPDGALDFLGRLDRQVKLRGLRIELGEIEAELARHPRVREAVVEAREDVPGEKRLVAYVVASDARQPSPSDLRQHLRERLPEYMVPAAFVSLERLPLFPNGKVDRRALPAPEVATGPGQGYLAPRTPVEETLARIWSEVLRVPHVGIRDHFFELGGDSVIALQVVARARQAGLQLRPKQFFDHPTLADLALQATPWRETSTGTAPEGRGVYPLTPMQRGMLAHGLAHPESTAYFQQYRFTLRGAVEGAMLAQAWQRVVDRQGALRTAFAWEGLEAPEQHLHAHAVLPVALLDWADASEDEQQQKLARYLDEDARRPFDLHQPPLMRVALIRRGEDRHDLVWSFHHLLLDGWSVPLVLREVFDAYEALRRGEPPARSHSRPISDYLAWLARQDFATSEPFWRQSLAEFSAPTPLGIDRRPATGAEEQPAELRHTLAPSLSRALLVFARTHQLTLNTVMTGAWALLLSRYSHSEEVVFGSTLSGRSAPLEGIEEMVGLLINTLPLRVQAPGEQSVVPWLRSLQERLVEVQQHEHSPLEAVRRCRAAPPGEPLFESLLIVENYPVDALLERAPAGLRIEDFHLAERTNFPLTLVAMPGEDLLLRALYDRNRFSHDGVARLLQHLDSLLARMCESPEARLATLSPLSKAERRQVLFDWNSTSVSLGDPRGVPERIQGHARRRPESLAVASNGERLTYAELDAQANHVAHRLRSLGVGPDVLVGICAERSARMIVGLLGILKAGGAYVPLDPTYPAERLAYMLEDAGASVLLTQSTLRDRFTGMRGTVLCLDTDLLGSAASAPEVPAARDPLAYVIYTSGSTGRPKGVAVPHSGLRNLIDWHQRAYAVTESDRATQVASPAFDASAWEVWPYLTAGASLHIPDDETRASPARLWEWFVATGVTLSFLPTPLAEALLQEPIPEGLSLRTLLTGGDRLRHRPREGLPFSVVNHYGPTEGTVVSTAAVVTPGPESEPPSIGRPIANTQAYVLDAHRNPVPIGVPGELYVAGAGLARGYWNQPGLTAERFLLDPFSSEPGARMYRTGDRVRWLSEGSLEFLGRVDEQVKLRGFRVELGEIEAVLTAHPDIREAVVLLRDDTSGGKRLVAYVVPREGVGLTEESARAFLKQRLPEYMVPSAVLLLPALPLTPHGKVDRKALPLLMVHAATSLPPRDAIEDTLARIWADVLRVEQVGIDDSFFALGGDSIVAMQIVARARQAGLHLTHRALFEKPTIRELARAATMSTAIDPGATSGEVPLTPVQRWFFEQGHTEPHHFNLAIMLDLREGVSRESLAGALDALADHHEALRLRFHRTPQGWRQEYGAQGERVALECVDLSGLKAEKQEPAFQAHAARLQAGLDLARGPLLRAAVFDLGADRPARLLLVIHHLAVDGVSWRILLEDLQASHAAQKQGAPMRLPARTTSFKTWAERLRGLAASPELAAEAEPWIAAGRQPPKPLPVDGPRTPGTASQTRTHRVTLDAEETQALLKQVPAAYQTRIDEVLLTALGQAFAAWTGDARLWLDLEGHGRESPFEDVDLSRTVGWFTSIYPVQLEVEATTKPGVALQAVKEQLRRIPRRGMGFGVLRYLGPEALSRPLQALASPEVSFNYLGQVDPPFTPDSPFISAQELRDDTRAPQGPRGHLLEVDATVKEGRLEVLWCYSEAAHRPETVRALADSHLAYLRALIGHCVSPDAGGYTPSDFPMAKLDQAALDDLLDELG
ncbi:amino acid adenylation domain-containing protein [Myxococcaceae bacterium GXIMD 01537]